MKTIELRIGNYININRQTYSVVEIKTTTIISTTVNGDIFKNELNIKQVKPIAITKEWLSKLDLKLRYETDDYTMHQFGDTEFDIIYDFAKLENKFSITFEGNPIAFVEYIHELQNFHFLLTKVQLILR